MREQGDGRVWKKKKEQSWKGSCVTTALSGSKNKVRQQPVAACGSLDVMSADLKGRAVLS